MSKHPPYSVFLLAVTLPPLVVGMFAIGNERNPITPWTVIANAFVGAGLFTLGWWAAPRSRR